MSIFKKWSSDCGFPYVKAVQGKGKGLQAEGGMLGALIEVFGPEQVVKSSEEEDRKEGTDFKVQGLPFDVTIKTTGDLLLGHDGQKKGEMIELNTLYRRGSFIISSKIRRGNGVIVFKQPTIVLEIKEVISKECISFARSLYELLRTDPDGISAFIEASVDSYWDLIDSMEESETT